MYEMSLDKIVSHTHCNPSIHTAISWATRLTEEEVRTRLSSSECIENYVRWYVRQPFHAEIVLRGPVETDLCHGEEALHLIIVQDRDDLLTELEPYLTSEHYVLAHRVRATRCLAHPLWESYPRDSAVLEAAIVSSDWESVEKVLQSVSPSQHHWTLASGSRCGQSMLALLREMVDLTLSESDWHNICLSAHLPLWREAIRHHPPPPPTVFYSAVLSGCTEMTDAFRSVYPDIHHDLRLDRTAEGPSTVLHRDCTYHSPHVRGETRYAHIMNYAVQSSSLRMVVDMHTRGYGITTSVILNAYLSSTSTILRYCLRSLKEGARLPSVLWMVLGLDCSVSNRVDKTLLLAPRLRRDISRNLAYQTKLSAYRQFCQNEKYRLEDPIWLLDLKEMIPKHSPAITAYWGQLLHSLWSGGESPQPPPTHAATEMTEIAHVLWGECEGISESNRGRYIRWGREDLVAYQEDDNSLWNAAGWRGDSWHILLSRNSGLIVEYLRTTESLDEIPPDVMTHLRLLRIVE